MRKSVHIRTKQHRRARSMMEDTNDAMAAKIAMDEETGRASKWEATMDAVRTSWRESSGFW